MRLYKKISLILCLSLLCACFHSTGAVSAASPNEDSAQTPDKWLRMGGVWAIENGRAIETRIRPVYWNYHELMNYNALIADEAASDFTEFSSSFGLANVRIFPVEVIMAFGLQSPEGHYYYNFFAVKFTGGAGGIKTAEIIRSKRKDASLPVSVKNNYTIETLYTQDCPLEYGKEYNVKITKSNNSKGAAIALYIDNKRIFSQNLQAAELKEKGKFAIGSRGASISIDDVTIKNGRSLVFSDNFETNSIFVPTVRAQKIN